MPGLRPASGTVNGLSAIFAIMMRWSVFALAVALVLSGCNGEIYLRDGVTDGNTFYLAERALADNDPVYQSWVRYSLARSACQLQLGERNPARSSSFDCELGARRILVAAWEEKRSFDPAVQHAYLDDLQRVQEAGFLDEYVARHFSQREWSIPDDLDLRAYRRWSRQHLRGHEPQTRITGSWNYARNTMPR